MKKKIKLPVLKLPKLKLPQLKLPKFFKFKGINSSLKSFYYTGLTSLIVVLFFFLTPKFVILKNNLFVKSIEIQNESKSNLEKVLSGKKIKEEQADELDNLQIFEDIFQYEDIPTSTVRLDASTIKQLFKDTKYNLKDVRKSKLVKPVNLELLPNEIKMIESTKERKNLFIQIILPLILEENNQIKFDRKKLFAILNRSNNSNSEKKWLNMKFKQYGVKNKDLLTLKIRMDEIPVSLAIAQSAKETGWGTSRFALQGNALFGQWTFSGNGIKPLGADSNQSHKVMKFQVLQASVRAYFRNLNTHSSYRDFRKFRAAARDNNEKLDSLSLADYLDEYAATGVKYTEILKKIIKQNSLQDFDDVKLLPNSELIKKII
ncbi:MAG: glucosaminidase domain-containing protein [Pelagibacterales bacterium]|nr:glucosaminidase domain-containing protein [Pelagibacterales bacterium]